MPQDIKAFDEAEHTLSRIYDRCSEVIFDPEASEDRKAEARAFRKTLGRQYDAGDGARCSRIRFDAIERAREFFGEPGFKG